MILDDHQCNNKDKDKNTSQKTKNSTKSIQMLNYCENTFECIVNREERTTAAGSAEQRILSCCLLRRK